jgi:branched-chain amino acid transport system ATP-binding protein
VEFADLSVEENQRVGAQLIGHANPGTRAEELYGLFRVLQTDNAALRQACFGLQ